MNKAILFLLLICAVAGIAFAQVDNHEEISPPAEQSQDSAIQEAPAAQQQPDGQVENDPDELGQDTPFQTQESPASKNPEAAVDNTQKTNTTEGEHSNFTDSVLLQGLNKITARTSKLEVKLGDSIKFGNLKITLHACWKSPPEEDPENKALLEMWEEIPGEPRSKIFSGWMFSSSPMISAPEHPVYDITVLSCTGKPVKAGKAKAQTPAETKHK